MRKLLLAFLLTMLSVPVCTHTAFADDDYGRDRHHGERHRDPHWRGDIHAFPAHDLDYWHSGRWHHGPHGGRNGWWWVLGNTWYYYPAPVYPFPGPYVPPAVTPVAATGYWYYCRHPRGYYPYVPVCNRPWHAVPAY